MKRKLFAAFTSLFLFTLSAFSQSGTMSVSPDVINLNATGNFEYVQCQYGWVIPSGYQITAHSVQMFMEGDFVTNSASITYCAIDNMLFVEFDRNEIQNSPVVQALANLGPIQVTIIGTFTVTNSLGASIVYPVDRTGTASIIRPGKRK
ncbi:MAG TPA: hypothetical protein P5531_10225 [Bacteroidales bacterium]|nr:hypothetical protein [Bacteroidales bacterium]HSA44015.1 hypothetical protein [Bacteroidales bacterium]